VPYPTVPCANGCGRSLRQRPGSTTGLCIRCFNGQNTAVNPQTPVAPAEQVAQDRQRLKQAGEIATLKSRYSEALKGIEERDIAIEALGIMKGSVDPLPITPQHSKGTGEATVVLVASDWHIEERVDPRTVSGMNNYDLKLAEERAKRFFSSGLRLTNLLAQDIKIDTAVLALLGDFFSGDIHEEIAEVCQVPPTEAVVLAQNYIIGGIDFLLNNSKLKLVIPCHSGNHARTTKTTRFGTENGHSLEYLLYRHLEAYYRSEPRVQIHVAEGMHSYLNIYNHTVRFQHGHAIKYNGGVGGIYIPVNKAIGQWNKAKTVDLDVFGHFHQLRDGGNFICNGSMIGYNTFALSIKADYEPPKQTLFMIDKDKGRTCLWPILFKR
jgi:hypothetical protein